MPTDLTNDPDTVIESLDEGPPRRLVYLQLVTGDRWAEIGTCHRCGLCEIGGANEANLEWDPTKRRGEPYSCSDPNYPYRPHVVSRPDVPENALVMAQQLGIEGGYCSLTFEVLAPKV